MVEADEDRGVAAAAAAPAEVDAAAPAVEAGAEDGGGRRRVRRAALCGETEHMNSMDFVLVGFWGVGGGEKG